MLPRTLRVIGGSTFSGCKYLKSVSYGYTPALGEMSCDSCDDFKGPELGSFVAPPSLKKIGNFAFRGCKNLKRVDLSVCTL